MLFSIWMCTTLAQRWQFLDDYPASNLYRPPAASSSRGVVQDAPSAPWPWVSWWHQQGQARFWDGKPWKTDRKMVVSWGFMVDSMVISSTWSTISELLACRGSPCQGHEWAWQWGKRCFSQQWNKAMIPPTKPNKTYGIVVFQATKCCCNKSWGLSQWTWIQLYNLANLSQVKSLKEKKLNSCV